MRDCHLLRQATNIRRGDDMAGLDTPTATYAPTGDPVLAGLHQKLLSDTDPLRLANASTPSTTDFTPGPTGTDTVAAATPGTPLTDASLAPTTPPPATTEVAAAAPKPAAVPSDLAPPPLVQLAPGDTTAAATAAAPTQVKLAQSDSAPAPVPAGAPASNSFSYSDAGSSCDDKTICNWNPNPNSTSQLTKDWFAAHGTQANASVDSIYKVKFGDDLESIARRELKAEGKQGASVKDEVAKIISLNHDHYKSLDCKPDFIRTGWTLKLNDNSAAPPQQADATPPPAPAPITTPDSTCKTDAPCGADVIVDNPNGQTFYNNKKVGDHDRAIITNGKSVEVPIPGSTHGAAPQRVGDTSPVPAKPADAAITPGTPTPAVVDASAAPAVAPKPIETANAAQLDTPAPVVTPKPVDSASTAAVPDTPPPVVVAKTNLAPAPDATAPTAATPDSSSTADLTPGPDEVQAPVAPANAPPPRRIAAIPAAPAKVAAPDAPTSAPSAQAAAVPVDGNDLGPG